MDELIDRAQALLFDLDGTLYQVEVPLERQIVPAIWRVASEILNVSESEAAAIVRKYRVQHGYFPHGFELHHGIPKAEMIRRVYAAVDRSSVKGSEKLKAAILDLSKHIPIWILTNSGKAHARECLERIGIAESISEIISIEDTNFNLKPSEAAYLAAEAKLQLPPNKLVYFDDSIRNIHMAWKRGYNTILVSNGVAPPPLFYEMHLRVNHTAPDYLTASTHDLAQFLEELSLETRRKK